jgi:cyclophilin family peptidyl-prolyl cis-trans isomerase
MSANMKFWLPVIVAVAAVASLLVTPKAKEEQATVTDANKPRVEFQTTKGSFTVELEPEKAPITTENFLGYVRDGYFVDTTFHRVIPNFMVQGGGLTADMREKPGDKQPIQNEADNGLKNERGTLAMARTSDPHSATSQFFINVKDNDFLDHRSKDMRGWGYAVFGRVVDGMDVVDAIVAVPTTSKAGHQDVPAEPIVITGVSELPAE